MKALPPLNALKVFEAAARHLSFTKAADELHVTPGAVSQQIKALEDYVGGRLFRRTKRALLLTDAAQASLPILREAFDKLEEASRILTARGDSKRLTVSVAPSLAAKWLVPRLDRFHERMPDIEVWISADMEVVDFAVDDVDLAIRYGAGRIVERISHSCELGFAVAVDSPRMHLADTPCTEQSQFICHFGSFIWVRHPKRSD